MRYARKNKKIPSLQRDEMNSRYHPTSATTPIYRRHAALSSAYQHTLFRNNGGLPSKLTASSALLLGDDVRQ